MKNMQEALFKDAMPEDVYKLMPGKSQITDQMLRDAYAGNQGVWITEEGGLDQFVYTAFEDAVTKIEGKFGTVRFKMEMG